MIDIELATRLGRGTVLHHVSAKNRDGTPVRARVNGKCRVWKTRPAEFQLPLKYGLFECFYLTPEKGKFWEVAE